MACRTINTQDIAQVACVYRRWRYLSWHDKRIQTNRPARHGCAARRHRPDRRQGRLSRARAVGRRSCHARGDARHLRCRGIPARRAGGQRILPRLCAGSGQCATGDDAGRWRRRVAKKRISAFAGSDLEVLLRANDIRHLVLCGIATSGVVLSTLREAGDKDYTMTVLSDLCADTGRRSASRTAREGLSAASHGYHGRGVDCVGVACDDQCRRCAAEVSGRRNRHVDTAMSLGARLATTSRTLQGRRPNDHARQRIADAPSRRDVSTRSIGDPQRRRLRSPWRACRVFARAQAAPLKRFTT